MDRGGMRRGWGVVMVVMVVTCQLPVHVCSTTTTGDPEVTDVTPKTGGTGGAVRLTVTGSNFKTGFNMKNDPQSGTHIKLQYGAKQYDCDPHENGITATTATCNTGPLPTANYTVSVTVDGKLVTKLCTADPKKCVFQALDNITPKVHSINASSGQPWSMYLVDGTLFTSKSASNAVSQNGRSESILRVYLIGNDLCILRDNNDRIFGHALFNNSLGVAGDKGYLICQSQSQFIGHMNLSIIVEGQFGRSVPNPYLLIVRRDLKTIAMLQQYTEAEPDANIGSEKGGHLLTFTGEYFEKTNYPVRVEIDGQPCTHCQLVSDTKITCHTPPKPDPGPAQHTGHRGLAVTTVEGFSDYTSTSINWSSGVTSRVDEAHYNSNSNVSRVVKMAGVVVAPDDGNYRFYLKGRGGAAMTVRDASNASETLVSLTSSQFSDGDGEMSNLVTLSKDSEYPVEALTGGSGHLEVEIRLRFLNTTLLARQTGLVNAEVQRLGFHSVVVRETQRVEVNSAGIVSGVSERQKIVLTGELSGTMRVGFHGVFTEFLPISTDGDKLTAALNKLPSMASQSVTVAVGGPSDNDNTRTYTITFPTELGNVRELEVEVSSQEDCTATVSTLTPGQSTQGSFRLLWGDTVTDLIPVNATAAQVQKALQNSISVRCHEDLSKGMLLADFEDSGVGDAEPFCGHKSARNPTGSVQLANEPDLSSIQGTLCFAHKGPLKSITLEIGYPTGNQKRCGTVELPISVPSANLSHWLYTCKDVHTEAKTVHPGNTDYSLKSFSFSRDDNDTLADRHLYVDQVVLHQGITGLNIESSASKMRLQQVRPNRAFIQSVTVTGAPGNYTIEIVPYNCSNTFGLFSVEGTTTSDSLAAGNDRATLTVSDGLSVDVKRVARASSPISGKFSVTFNGETSGNITVDGDLHKMARAVRDTLGQVTALGDVEVTGEGHCADFSFKVVMAARAGDQELMTVNDEGLAGNGVTFSVTGVDDGSLRFIPIPGDMLRIVYLKPQATVYINDIPSSCNGDCSYTWSSDHTPTITGINPTSGTLGTTITITGTLFNAALPADNTVQLGPASCTVTAVPSPTSLECTASEGPAGPQPVSVRVASKGLSCGDFNFTYVILVSDVAPTTGSYMGGVILTVRGQGFGNDTQVTVGGEPCVLLTRNWTQAECRVPAYPPRTDGNATVTVETGGETLTADTQFSYSSSATPQITHISTNAVSAPGGDEITITGTGFGSAKAPTVTINNVTLTVMSHNSTQVVVRCPPLGPGAFRLRLLVDDVGYADSSVNVTIVITLKVTDVSPLRGSQHGGTLLSISGEGFGTNATLVEVKVGGHVCKVKGVSDTLITCRVCDTGAKVVVKNQQEDNGPGFAWEPKHATIEVGDTVHWQWSVPTFVTQYAFGVKEVSDHSSPVTLAGGFASQGPNTANGQFQHRFTIAGVYYYWSGYLNEYNTLYMRGKVTVTAKPSTRSKVSVRAGGPEAQHILPASTGRKRRSTSDDSCGSCPSDSQTSSDTSFHFIFDPCATPTVTSITPQSGTASTGITLQGTGFGTSSTCENKVFYADDTVGQTVSNSANTQMTFTLNTDNSPPIKVSRDLRLRVGNHGNALVAIRDPSARLFALLPSVTSISPTSGSQSGETLVTITGVGLSATSVSISRVECRIQSQTYHQVTCMTPPSSSAQAATVSVKIAKEEVGCSSTICQFTYDVAMTPTLSDVSPDSINTSPVNVTISGTRLGSEVGQVAVKVGGRTCTVLGVTDTQLSCTVSDVPAGSHVPQVVVSGKGKATGQAAVQSEALITSVTPTQGSVHGGTSLTLTGHGFSSSCLVTLDSNPCPVTSQTGSVITCVTPSHAAGQVGLDVTCQNVPFPANNFTYSSAVTPTVTSVSPSEGRAGDAVEISGTGFAGVTVSELEVKVGGQGVTVTGVTSASVSVVLGSLQTGVHPVRVKVVGRGLSNDDVTVEYSLGNFTFGPLVGTTGGHQVLTLEGSGFLPGGTNVTICGLPCRVLTQSVNATHLKCSTSPNPVTTPTDCDVTVSVNDVSKTASQQFRYDNTITPHLTNVSPKQGGTAGGTTLTLTGIRFGNVEPNPPPITVTWRVSFSSVTSAVSVTVAGAACDVKTVTDTQITCTTNGSLSGTYSVDVVLNSFGNGTKDWKETLFRYIDRWSSVFTWGGTSLPVKGDFVVIPAGKIILLDTTTPVLALLLIQGELIFDEATTAPNLGLHSEKILINGGKLQVGTESKPFPAQATITLHGHLRSKELPVYGTKCLAVREGTLDLHGKPVTSTWTVLDQTAEAGSQQITLATAVDWKAGDEIVLSTTNHRHSQKENEVHFISAISADGRTLTLRDTLTYKHVVKSHLLEDGTMVTVRGEVGLLTRNVVVRGSTNDQWERDQIPACPEGFNTGEFATQTCFQGRFGEEMGSDQFGAQLMVHTSERDSQVVQAHLSFVEFRHCGQAFRLGRYPIHFHLNGDLSRSYVRGVAIHNSFNRAVNIHGTHNVLVENTVIYNIMGGAFFLEDGIEHGNVFRDNLAVFVRSSPSLQNDDVTPAAFWVTNPNNSIENNHAAGGTHFGFWYRMHKNPSGPSHDPAICPQNAPLGTFINNTVHSQGWFGLWIFETYTPRIGGGCNSADTEVAVFRNLTVWNCEKGAEVVNGGAIQLRGFKMINNEKAGIEWKLLIEGPMFDETNGAGIHDTLIAANLGNKLNQEGSRACTKAGIVLNYLDGMLVTGTRFHNFNQGDCAAFEYTTITGTTADECGGFATETVDLSFYSVTQKVRFRWASEGTIFDRDGTLTGSANHTVVPSTGDLPPQHCTPDSSGGPFSTGSWPGAVCGPAVQLRRFSFNNPRPRNWLYKNAHFTNQYGMTVAKFREKRLTHKNGWMVLLVNGESYKVNFENGVSGTNISLNGAFNLLRPEDHIILSIPAGEPDRSSVNGGRSFINQSSSLPDPDSDSLGAWWHNETVGNIVYLVKTTQQTAGSVTPRQNFNLKAFKCFYKDCTPPPDPTLALQTPGDALLWSQNSSWGWRTGGKPIEGDNVTIPLIIWIVIDEELPQLDFLIVEGGVSVVNSTSFNATLDVNYLIILGRLVVGWPDDPFPGNFRIRLRGSKSSPEVPFTGGPVLGAKVIAVYGCLDLHGWGRNVSWTRLAQPVDSGNTLHLQDTVDWSAGDDVMLTPTDHNPWHVEVFRVTAVSEDGTVLTLNDTVQFGHQALTQNLSSGERLDMRARVALLTRNIVVEGESYDNLVSESFGGRIIIGRTRRDGNSYRGFARITNTEFFHMGQEGHSEPWDPRFPVAFVDSGTISESRPSYVRHNSFHNNFSPAVGLTASDNVEVSHNVIYMTVGMAIYTNSKGTKISHNLICLVVWPGTYQDREEPFNVLNQGAIEAMDSTDLEMADNVVAGSERIAYHVPGQKCGTADDKLWRRNEAHSCLLGVTLWPHESPVSSNCSRWNGFFLWKIGDVAMYLNGVSSQLISGLTSVDNGLGYTGFVIGPSATSHSFEFKFVKVCNSTFVGRTSTYDCVKDALDTNDANIRLSALNFRFWRKNSCGMTAIMYPTFTSGSNKAPIKPLANIMSYPAIQGTIKICDSTFEGFQGNDMDFMFATNQNNEDMPHPLCVSHVNLHNVDTANIAFFHRPSTGPINPSDCVDMTCDGNKKALLIDKDGSLLGSPGTIVPDAGFQWDGDRAYGIGDYRIPKVMLTDKNGNRIDADVIAPNKGIYNTGNCTFRSQWNAYHCDNRTSYAVLVIESMDADTETRRLSPVAVYSGGYVDLLNGPQDHGWCSGYTCRKRLSTFFAIVPAERKTDLYMTGTVPDKIRFMLLNAEEDVCVALSIWKRHSNRMDASVDGQLRLPLNGYLRNGSFFLKVEDYPEQYMPALENRTMGDHYVDRRSSQIHWVLCGSGVFQLTKQDVVIVSFGLPALTVDDFFGENLIFNLATFLDIPLEKVRIVDVVREDSQGRRKRSSGTPGVYLFVEVGEGPVKDNTNVVVDLAKVSDKLITQAEIYGMDEVLNTTVLTISILDPVSASDNQTGADGGYRVIRKVGSMELALNPSGASETLPFAVQPLLRFRSSDGTLVENLGTNATPWQVEANILSPSNSEAKLLGNRRLTFENGVVQFTDLAIDFPGDYVLRFTVTEPKEASNYSLDTLPFKVAKRSVALLGALMTHGPLVNSPIQLSFRLVDPTTNRQITDLNWRNHTWTVTASLAHPEVYRGRLEGNYSATVDPATATAEFKDIRLSDPGLCLVTFTLTSDPPEFTVTGVVEVPVMTVAQWKMVVERKVVVEVRLTLTYDLESAKVFAVLVRNHYGQRDGIRIIAHAHRAGSIVVTLTIEGTRKGVDAILADLCNEVHQGTTFTYGGTTATLTKELRVDGKEYYGDVCYRDTSLHPGVIAAIVLACVLVVVLVVFALLWRIKVYPKTKTFDTKEKPGELRSSSLKYAGTYRTDNIEDILFREDTFMSLKSRGTPTPLPPVTTALDAHRIQWRGQAVDLPPMPGTPDLPKQPLREGSATVITPLPAKTDF